MLLPALLLAVQAVTAVDTSLTVLPPRLHPHFLPQPARLRDTTQNDIVLHNDGDGLPASLVYRVLHRRGVAYHFFIARDGTVTQFMPLSKVAEHAGRSRLKDRTHWNDFSIGICLQGSNLRGYTAKQYESLRHLIRYLHARYPDSRTRRIVGHQHIAAPRGRKSDPGRFFNWKEIDPLRLAFHGNPDK